MKKYVIPSIYCLNLSREDIMSVSPPGLAFNPEDEGYGKEVEWK